MTRRQCVRTLVVVPLLLVTAACGSSSEPIAAPTSALNSPSPFVINAPRTPVPRTGGASYADLEQMLGWRALQVKEGGLFNNSLIQRRITELPAAGVAMLSEVYVARDSLEEVTFRQVPGEASVAPPPGSSRSEVIGFFNVRVYVLASGDYEARFLTGAVNPEGVAIAAIARARSESTLLAFIGALVTS